MNGRSLGAWGAAWALLGFTLMMGWALVRLTPMAVEALTMELGPLHWLALVANVLFMAYSEGYRGFQKSFSPKFVARIEHLVQQGSWIEHLLAPLFAMGFFNTTRRQLIISYALALMIVGFVLLFKIIPQPWRGILDAGVVVGLAWGLIVTLSQAYQHWLGRSAPELTQDTTC